MAFERELRRYLQFARLEKGLSEHSLDAYRRDLTRYLRFLGDVRGIHELDGVSLHHIESYLEELAALGLAPASMARNISSIRGFHDFASAEGMSASNPAEVVELPKKASVLPEVLSTDEIVQMLGVPDRERPEGKRAVAILELLYATGMRVSELCGLTVDRLVFEIGYVRVIGKGAKERLIPVGGFAVEAVNDWLKHGRPLFFKTPEAAKGAVFLNQRGTPLSRMSVWNLVNETARSAGIAKQAYPHIFRHSCATHMLEGGADLRTVQEMLGHASILTTEIYTHVDRSLLQQTHKMYHPRA